MFFSHCAQWIQVLKELDNFDDFFDFLCIFHPGLSSEKVKN